MTAKFEALTGLTSVESRVQRKNAAMPSPVRPMRRRRKHCRRFGDYSLAVTVITVTILLVAAWFVADI